MTWTVASPLDNWQDREVLIFLREIYKRIRFASFTWNPGSVGADSTLVTTLTITDAPEVRGLRVGMPVHVSPAAAIDTGLSVDIAYVATDDTLTIRLRNHTAAPINEASGTWTYIGFVI